MNEITNNIFFLSEKLKTSSSWSRPFFEDVKITCSQQLLHSHVYIRAGRCWNCKTDSILLIENQYIRYTLFGEDF
mgnify:FL=1